MSRKIPVIEAEMPEVEGTVPTSEPPRFRRQRTKGFERTEPKKTSEAESNKRIPITIRAPNFKTARFSLIGTAPYVANKFTQKNMAEMMRKQEAGERARKERKRSPKDFDSLWRQALHISKDGWIGLPASGIRNAMISACRLVGFKMTIAKMSIFVLQDGVDAELGTPLVRLDGKPVRKDIPVVLANGSTDILPRPFFEEWSCECQIEWDGDQFGPEDVFHLLMRAGRQVGLGAGRPDSSNSNGMGWGLFDVETVNEMPRRRRK